VGLTAAREGGGKNWPAMARRPFYRGGVGSRGSGSPGAGRHIAGGGGPGATVGRRGRPATARGRRARAGGTCTHGTAPNRGGQGLLTRGPQLQSRAAVV
jgi:hypothetical protein